MANIGEHTTTFVASFATSEEGVIDGLPIIPVGNIAWPDDRPDDYEADSGSLRLGRTMLTT